MANEYNIISDEALDTLCGAIKGIANAGEIVDDTGVAMDKTYSSFKIQEELDKKIEGDNVVKKDDIVAVLDNTVTDEQVPSGKAVVDELGLKANDDEVVKKTDIVTTIDKTSTDDTVPSTSAIYNKSKNKINEVLSGGDITTYADGITSETVTDTVRIMNGTNSPYGTDNTDNDFHYTIYNIADDRFKRIVAYDVRKNDMYMIMKNAGTWGEWQRVFTTTVADVPVTRINIINGIVNPDCKYQVKNGICYIQFNSGTYTLGGNVSGLQLATNMPIPASGSVSHTYVPWASSDASKQVIVLVDGNGKLLLHAPAGANGCNVFCTFSYPVAE